MPGCKVVSSAGHLKETFQEDFFYLCQDIGNLEIAK
jgi:hypothetical protein